MTTSKNGRLLIESLEGLELVAYPDQRGIWTIGFGHVDPAVVKKGLTCTEAEADAWLALDLHTAESAVNRLVKAPLTQNQFDALVSLTFNIGQGNFLESTVLKKLNLTIPTDYAGAADAILMWNRTAGEVNPGLMRRREAEKALFMTAEGVI